MTKLVAMIGVLVAVIFLGAGHPNAADPPVMNSQYLKEHFPDVYIQIYQEGKAAGKKEAEAAIKDGTPPVQTTSAIPEPAISEKTSVAAQQAKPDLGAWWEKSSLKFTSLPEQWLFHIEGTLDYKHKTGNTESDLYNGSASLTVRKLRFTNTLSYIISKEFTKQSSQPGSPVSQTDSDYRSWQESFRYDLTRRLYAEGGYIWEKDTANYINGRDSYYAGIGFTLIDTPKFLLDVLVAGGYENEKYPETVRMAMDMEENSMRAGYFKENFRWNITDRITYKQSFRIIRDFTRTKVFNDELDDLHVIGETNRYRWFLINEIHFKIVEHLTFMTGYKIEYDSNPWPTVEKLDTTIKSGLQFSF